MQKSVIPKQQQYRLVLADTWWYGVSMEWYWLIYDGTGSYGAILGLTWWYWISIGRYWLVLGGTESVEGGNRSV